MLLWPLLTTYNTAVQSEPLTSIIYPSATWGGTGELGESTPPSCSHLLEQGLRTTTVLTSPLLGDASTVVLG